MAGRRRLAVPGPLRRARSSSRGRHGSAPGFRPSAPASAGLAPTRSQAIALLAGLALVASLIAVVAFVIKPAKARSFDLFYGQLYIDDDTSPVAIDLASGKPTVRLSNAYTAVSARSGSSVDVVPLSGGNTLMLDPTSGEFNMVDSTGFVVKSSGGGVVLPKATGATTASAVPAGSSAYILRSGPASTSFYLVSASTVASAVGRNSKATARAYATLSQSLSNDPGSAASADGALWVLTDAGGTARRITQLRVPAGSNAGVTLASSVQGSTTGASAIEAATRKTDGTGGQVVGAADSRSVQVFSGAAGAAPVTASVSVGKDVDRILPASNAQGELVYLYHSQSSGWSRVSVPVTGASAARVTALRAVPHDAALVAPAQSDGRAYTMDTSGDGTIWQIERNGVAQPVAGAPSYPLLPSERPQLTDSRVVADAGRVIVNSRTNLEAEVIFSDGSHAPRAVQKHSAVQVDPSGATTLADAHATNKSTSKGRSKAKPTTKKRATQTINNKIDCKTTKQIPHIPTLIAGDRAARSIELRWNYPVLDPADCIPSTYAVGIKVLSSGAPSPPSGQITVQGQNGVTLTGLFPATEYELTVTAYLGKQHSTSQPIRVTTGPEGPAAPTGVAATTDSSGNWTVSWNSCGGVKQGCVPSATWYVIPHFCDGRGLSNVPDRVTVPGDPTVHSFTHVYAGGDALLGRALCFQIQGVSPQGTVGTTSASSQPAFSWTTPNAGALTLNASQPGDVAFGATTSTTVNLDLGGNPARDVGGVGATFAIKLTGAGGTQTKNLTWDGRSDRVSTTFTGIKAGSQYTATASIAPPNHPGNAVSKGPVTVVTRAHWPSISANASCPTGGGAVTLSCRLIVQLSGPSSAQANGERFNLLNGQLLCGNTSLTLDKSNFDPANTPITADVNLLQYNGSCSVQMNLVEAGSSTGPRVFGGTTSPLISRSVDLGQASAAGAGRGDFSASFNPSNPVATIHYGGDKQAEKKLTFNWHEQIYAPDGTRCGGDNNFQSGPPDVTLDLRPYESCTETQGDQTGWTFSVSYQDIRDGATHTFDGIGIPGKPAGFVPPCRVFADSFGASWTGSADNPSVTVTFTNGSSDLSGCSGFSYTVQEPVTQVSCASRNEGNTPPASDDISTARCKNDLSLPGNWTVEIDYSSARHDAQPITISAGSPPQPTPTPTPTPSPSPSSS